MSKAQEKEYYRQYMRGYYQKHKDYWRDYYLKKKQLTKRGGRSAYRNRRHYLERVNAAWSQVQTGKNPLSRLLRRLSSTSIHYLEPASTHPPRQKDKTNEETRSAERLRIFLMEILRREGFIDIQFPVQESEVSLGQALSNLQAFALRESKRCIIEFAGTPFKAFTRKKRDYLKTLLNFFGAKYFLCFIKPDLSRYHLIELEPTNMRSIALGLKTIAAMKLASIIT